MDEETTQPHARTRPARFALLILGGIVLGIALIHLLGLVDMTRAAEFPAYATVVFFLFLLAAICGRKAPDAVMVSAGIVTLVLGGLLRLQNVASPDSGVWTWGNVIMSAAHSPLLPALAAVLMVPLFIRSRARTGRGLEASPAPRAR